MNKNKILMLVFVGSESFFFISLIFSYLYFNYHGGKMTESSKYLDILKTGIFTLFLLSSSLAAVLCENKLKKNKAGASRIWLIITILLGAVFLAGQGMEYNRLIQSNLTISRDVFGSTFFTLTGFHGLHVLLGLLVLSIIFIVLKTGKFKSVEQTAVSSAMIYWHFVDAVWLVVFSVVYIGAYL